MHNSLRRLKFLPWLPLFQVAALTVFFALVLDVLLAIALVQMPLLQPSWEVLLSPPVGIMLMLAIAFGIGILAVYLLERLHPDIVINASILWALVLCVLLMLALESLLHLPMFLVSLNQTTLMGMVVGVFWRGRAYWRR
jgi:hypothetical protein